MESQGNLNSQNILRKKNKAGGFPFADLKTYYKAAESKHGTGVKTYIQTNGIEWRAQKDPHIYDFQQMCQDHPMGKCGWEN